MGINNPCLGNIKKRQGFMAEEIYSDSLRVLLGLPFMVSLFLCNNIKWNKVIEFIERIENKGSVEERYFNFINSSQGV